MAHNGASEVTFESIVTARRQIEGAVLRTPLLPSPGLSAAVGAGVALKCENLQYGGAFKARGACNAVFSLSPDAAAAGVATHSSGNHAAAVARAAALRGIPAYIVMPRNSSELKLQAVRRYGVGPVLSEPTPEARQAKANEVVAETGASFIHPYDDPHVIAGQGTVGLEIDEQAGGLDAVIVPVGGGGLLAGCLTALKACRPRLKVYGAEPRWADDASRSLQAGEIQMPTRYDTVADGLRTSLGQIPFAIIRRLVDDILLVDEEAIRTATWMMVHLGRVVAEPSGSVPLACLLQHRELFAGKSVALVVSGGNFDVSQLADWEPLDLGYSHALELGPRPTPHGTSGVKLQDGLKVGSRILPEAQPNQ